MTQEIRKNRTEKNRGKKIGNGKKSYFVKKRAMPGKDGQGRPRVLTKGRGSKGTSSFPTARKVS